MFDIGSRIKIRSPKFRKSYKFKGLGIERKSSHRNFKQNNKGQNLSLSFMKSQDEKKEVLYKDMETNTDSRSFSVQKSNSLFHKYVNSTSNQVKSFRLISPVSFLPNLNQSKSVVAKRKPNNYLKKYIRYIYNSEHSNPKKNTDKNRKNYIREFLKFNINKFNA